MLAGGDVVKAAFDEYHAAGNKLDALSPAARHIVEKCLEKCLEGAHNGRPDGLQDLKGSKKCRAAICVSSESDSALLHCRLQFFRWQQTRQSVELPFTFLCNQTAPFLWML